MSRPTSHASAPIPVLAAPVGGPSDGLGRRRIKSAGLPALAAVGRVEYEMGFASTRQDSVMSALHSAPLPALLGSRAADGGRGYSLVDAVSDDGSIESFEDGGLNPSQGVVNMVKCAIGAGSFSLPYAFQQGGLWASFIGTLFLGALSAYTVNLLAQAERQVWHMRAQERKDAIARVRDSVIMPLNASRDSESGRGGGEGGEATRSRYTYPQLGREVFRGASCTIGGSTINAMELVIYIGIVLTSLGVCAAYVDFITGTLPTIWPSLTVASSSFIIAPIMIALALLRTFKWLSFTSILGDVAVTVGLISVVVYGFMHPEDGKGLQWDLPALEAKTIPQFFASTSFLFAIHIVVLPIAQSLKRPDHFTSVTSTSYVFITVINALFGGMCYMLFGAGTQSNVVHNLGSGAFLAAIKILLCIDLLFTIPMVLAASREIVEEYLLLHFPACERDHEDLTRNTVRVLMVGAVFAVCFGVPDFIDAVNLVGGFVNALMGFVVPPLIYLKLQSERGRLTAGTAFVHGLIMLFGVVALVVSTYYTIDGIVNPPKKH